MNRIATSFLILAVAGISPSLPATANHVPTLQVIAKGGVAVGMTKQQVLQFLGRPTRKQSETVWYYAEAGDGPLTIYFKGNKVSGFGGQG